MVTTKMSCLAGLTKAKWSFHQVKSLLGNGLCVPDRLLQELSSLNDLDRDTSHGAQQKAFDTLILQLQQIFQSLLSKDNGPTDDIFEQFDCDMMLTIVMAHSAHCLLHAMHDSASADDLEKQRVLSGLFTAVRASSWLATDAQLKRCLLCLRAVLHVATLLIAQAQAKLTNSLQCLLSFMNVLLPFAQTVLESYSSHKKAIVVCCEDLLPALFAFTAMFNQHFPDEISLRHSIRSLLTASIFRGESQINEMISMVSLDPFSHTFHTPQTIKLESMAVDDITKDLLATNKLLLSCRQKSVVPQQEKLLACMISCLAAAKPSAVQHAVSAVAVVFEIFTERSVKVEEGFVETGYRKHVVRVLQMAATLLTFVFKQFCVEGSYVHHLDAAIAIAHTKRIVLQIVQQKLHSLPNQMTKQTNFLFCLFRHCLQNMHLCTVLLSTEQESEMRNQLSTVLALELDSLRLLNEIDHHFLLENKSSLFSVVDAPYGDDAVQAAKKRVFHQVWELFGNLRILDVFCKSLVAIGSADSPYQMAGDGVRHRPSTICQLLEGSEVVVNALRGVPKGQWTNLYYILTRQIQFINKVLPRKKESEGEESIEEIQQAQHIPNAPNLVVNDLQYQLLSHMLFVQHSYLLPAAHTKAIVAGMPHETYCLSMVNMLYQLNGDMLAAQQADRKYVLLYLHLLVNLMPYLIKFYMNCMSDLLDEITIYTPYGLQLAKTSMYDLLANEIANRLDDLSDPCDLPVRLQCLLNMLQYLFNMSAKTSADTMQCELKLTQLMALLLAVEQDDQHAVQICDVLLKHIHIWSKLGALDVVQAAVIRGLRCALHHRCVRCLVDDSSSAIPAADMDKLFDSLHTQLHCVLAVDSLHLQGMVKQLLDEMSSPSAVSALGGHPIAAQSAIYMALVDLLPIELLSADLLTMTKYLTAAMGMLPKCDDMKEHRVVSRAVQQVLMLLLAAIPDKSNRLVLVNRHALLTLLNTLLSSSMEDELVQQLLHRLLVHVAEQVTQLARYRFQYKSLLYTVYNTLYHHEIACIHSDSDAYLVKVVAAQRSWCDSLISCFYKKTAADTRSLSALPACAGYVVSIVAMQVRDLQAFFNDGDAQLDCIAGITALKLSLLSGLFSYLQSPSACLLSLQQIGVSMLCKLPKDGPYLGSLQLLVKVMSLHGIAQHIPTEKVSGLRALLCSLISKHCLAFEGDAMACKRHGDHIPVLVQSAEQLWLSCCASGGDTKEALRGFLSDLFTSSGPLNSMQGMVMHSAVQVSITSALAMQSLRRKDKEGDFADVLEAVLQTCSMALCKDMHTPVGSKRKTSSDDFLGPRILLLSVVAEKLLEISQLLCGMLGDKPAKVAQAGGRGTLLAATRRFAARCLPMFVQIYDLLAVLTAAVPEDDDLLQSQLQQQRQRALMLLLDLTTCMLRGLVANPAQQLPAVSICLAQAMDMLSASYRRMGRVSALSSMQLLVRVVSALASLDDLRTQKPALLLSLVHALADAMAAHPKRVRSDDFARVCSEGLFPAFFPLMERLDVKDKERAFLQMNEADRALLNDLQDVYTRNYKYKGY